MRKLMMSAAAALMAFAVQFSALAQTVPVNGEVTKVDTAQSKITLKHGPIKNLDMDAMTMVFRVADPAMLSTVKPGDQVTFEAERVNGQLTVTKLKKK